MIQSLLQVIFLSYLRPFFYDALLYILPSSQIQQQYMKNKSTLLDQSLDRSIPELSKSFVYTPNDSMKSISDCTTLFSEADFMEESYQTQAQQDLETSFKKQLSVSQNLSGSCNPNAKKNTFLVVETPKKPLKKVEIKSVHYESELSQLENIEKKTQDLVMKEKQQRRELKKLKKLYIEKVEQLTRCQQLNQKTTTTLQDQIAKLISHKNETEKEKVRIEKAMRQLELEVQKTKIEILGYKEEREHLIHKIELLEINFEPKSSEQLRNLSEFDEKINDKKSENLDRQIKIINKMIKDKKENADHKEISKLLEVKLSLVEQRQQLKIKEERQRQEKTISKLNQVILSRNNLLRTKGKPAVEAQSEQQLHKPDEKFVETSDTFFQDNKQQEHIEQQQEQTAQWDQFKNQVRKVVQTNSIVGYEQSYQAIETIVLGMIHLFENETCSQEDVIELLQTSLDNLSSKYADKAKRKVAKIEQMLSFMNKTEKRSRKATSKDQQNCPSFANVLQNKTNT